MPSNRQSGIVRKRFSLTKHHDELLDKIVSQRYASRSEALRVAIQHHAQYLSEGGETDIDSLLTEIEHLRDEIEEVHDKVEEQGTNAVEVTEQVSRTPANKQDSTPHSEVEDTVANQLADEKALSVKEIAAKSGSSLLSIAEAVESLKKKGIVQQTTEDGDRYELTI